ncbi:GPI-GlcNAc transferase complex, PIG-H component-domain-containing protein [Microdochium trichocladiopsis]|uniref:GPI-GlcNAc transferase complex, PIG-H component-domain-containing protein n=1 Tax=Microdochium trichocladiopsis TaxID=1682393 RepID=A0A9P8YJH0_9PEZI|nr:GPI-GlcNAc transferase complex, PIG-H component-domain-containing protein [Microdochium trichocladiopsis]KAH7040164.1 GPI-GlcNAc transferase complex, PIG-H component-domain-containing protein [Microdochium trichocladiopsis]
MLTTRPYLRTRRPSPTTVEFVVTTRPVLTTPLRVLLYTVYLARVLLGLGIVLLLLATWDACPFTSSFAPPFKNNTAAGSRARLAQQQQRATTSDEFVWHTIHHVLHATTVGRLALDLVVATVGLLSPAAAAAAATSPMTTSPPAAAAAAPTTAVLLSWLALPPIYLLALYYLVLRRIHTEERLLVLRGLGIQTSSSAATVLGSSVTRFIPTDKIQDVLVNEAFRGFEVRHYLIVVVEGEEDVVVVFPKLLPGPVVVEKVWRGVRRCLYEQHYQGNGVAPSRGAGTRSSGSTSPEKEGSPTKR